MDNLIKKIDKIDKEITDLKSYIIKKEEDTKFIEEIDNLSIKSKLQTFDKINMNLFSNELDKDCSISQLENYSDIISQCKSFCISNEHPFNGLVFRGDTGTGKTYMCNCIANLMISNGYSVRYYSSVELFQIINDTIISKTIDRRFYDFIYECDLLIIDNFGTEIKNNFTISHLLNIIEKRESYFKKTIISTTLSLTELIESYGNLVFGKLFDYYAFINFIGKDLRLRALQNKKD